MTKIKTQQVAEQEYDVDAMKDDVILQLEASLADMKAGRVRRVR